jgi:trigger factor
MAAGDERTFTSQLVGGDQAGEDVEVEVTVGSVKEQELPELDDDFAQTASEFDTVDELREDVRTRLSRSKRLEQAAEARDAVLEKLLDLVDVPLPDGVVESEIAARREQVVQQLDFAGLSLEQYLDSEKQTVDEFEADLEKRVRDAVAAQFVLDQVARQEEIGVDEGELQAHLMQRAQQSGQNPQEFIKHMLEHNHIPEMVSEVVRGKALATVVESAEVTDASGNHVELKNLQPDGTIADPTADPVEDEPAPESSVEADERPVDA